MQQQVNLKIKGLYTAPNDFSGVPDGALDVADDCVIDHDNLGEPRRGFDLLAGSFASVSDRANRFTNYQSHKIAQYGTGSLGYYDTNWVAYSGTYAHPDPLLAKVRFMEANQNLYITTSTGIKKLDKYNGTPASAGVPKGLDLQLALSGSSGFFTTNVAATPTLTTTNGAATLSLVSSLTGIAVGQYISGTGIPAGTTVASVGTSATVLITTGNTTVASNQLTTLAVTTGIAANQFITGNGIPAGTRVVSIVATTVTMSQNAFATATGVTVTFSSDPLITMSANATASGSITATFSSGSQVGYRVLFGIRDANNNVIYGYPSQFAAITNNTGGTRNVDVTFTIPAGITTSHFYQIYRSPQTAGASITPLDDEQLVYEGNPTSGDITNGYVTVTDITPDSLRGAYIYTAVSQEGILQGNEPPPFAKDFCAFNQFAIYANTRSKQRKKFTILSVGSPNGLQVNDTITIAGVTYTAKSSETIASAQFAVASTGTPAQNITDTANSLIRVINRYSGNTAVYAFLLSGPTDLPGQILLEEKGTGASSFAITTSGHGTAYSPTLPTSGTSVSSMQDTFKNGILISKSGQPEAVPTTNLLFAGNASNEILRVIPLREYVVILKTDGIYRLTGNTLSTMQVAPFDLTTKLIAPDSAVALSNEVWGFFDQGVCSVADTGVNVRSREIENVLRDLVGAALSTIKTISFAIAYETDRKYILALPDSDGDTSCPQQYIFNLFTKAWVRWTRDVTAGFVDPTDDKLYIGNGFSNTVSFERKTNTFRDFVDEGFAVTITASSVKTVTLVTVSGITIGDVLYQSSSLASVITDIDVGLNTVTVGDLLTWSNGAASILPAVQNVLQWKPLVAGNPVMVRQYSEGSVIFKRTRFSNGTMSFYSDVSQSFESAPLTGTALALWGTFPWGTAPWGGVNRPKSKRFLVPQNKQMASQLSVRLTIRNGYSDWASEGLSISFNPVSQEIE